MPEDCASLSVVDVAAKVEVDDSSLCPSDSRELGAAPLPRPRPREPFGGIAVVCREPKVLRYRIEGVLFRGTYCVHTCTTEMKLSLVGYIF
jgi:hypothetical protein